MYKIIIIEDERETREGLCSVIDGFSLNARVAGQAEDGVQGLQLAVDVKPDVALIDVRMPIMDGIECAKAIRERVPDCSIIFMSGYTDKEYLKSAIRLQAVDYIEKPMNINEIFDVVSRAILIRKEKKEKKLKSYQNADNVKYNDIMIKRELTFELIHKNIDISSLQKKFDRALFPVNDNYLCILLDFNLHKMNNGEDSFVLRKNGIIDIIKNESEDLKDHYLFGIEDSGVAIIHVFGDIAKNKDKIHAILENIQCGINKLLNCELAVTIGVGRLVSGVRKVYQSYQDARRMIYKRFILGYNNIIFYNDGENLQKDGEDEAIYKKLREYADNVTFDNAVDYLDKMAGCVRRLKSIDVSRVKEMFLAFFIKITIIIKEKNLITEENEMDEAIIWMTHLNFYALDEIESFITAKLNHYKREYDEQKGKSKKIRNVMNYVLTYYSEPLTISSIAEYVGLSANYLSTLFKTETEITINDYITLVRIEKSKQFLKDGSIKQHEVSHKVGFNNPNYFSTVFKKVTGMYPSEYRKNILS